MEYGVVLPETNGSRQLIENNISRTDAYYLGVVGKPARSNTH